MNTDQYEPDDAQPSDAPVVGVRSFDGTRIPSLTSWPSRTSWVTRR